MLFIRTDLIVAGLQAVSESFKKFSRLISRATRLRAPLPVRFLPDHVVQEQENANVSGQPEKGKKLSFVEEEYLHHEYLHQNGVLEEPVGLQPVASHFYDCIDHKGRGQCGRCQTCQVEEGERRKDGMQIHSPAQLGIEQKEVQPQGKSALQDEEGYHRLHEPILFHQLPVKPSEAILGGGEDVGLWHCHCVRRIKQFTKGLCHGIAGRAPFEQVQRPSPLPVIQVLQDHLLGQLQGIYQSLLLGEFGFVYKALNHEIQQDEYYIDQCHGRAVEIVIIAGYELAQFINERSKAQAPQNRNQVIGRLVNIAQTDDEGHHHEHPSQKHMGDMQVAGAETGVAGKGQEEAYAQDGSHSSDKEYLQQTSSFQAAHEVAVEELHSRVPRSYVRILAHILAHNLLRREEVPY